jgi:hypothetical protein
MRCYCGIAEFGISAEEPGDDSVCALSVSATNKIIGSLAVMVDWHMVPSAGDAVAAAGRDVFIVDADHRILIDYQFIVG